MVELFVHQRVCNLLRYDAGDLNSYPWVFLNYYPKPGEKKLRGAIKVNSVSFADPYNGIPWCLIEVTINFEHLRDYPTRAGPVVVRLMMGRYRCFSLPLAASVSLLLVTARYVLLLIIPGW